MKLVEFFFESADELQSHAVHRQTGHKRQTAIGSLLAEEDAKAFGITFDLIEEQSRNRARALAVDQLRHRADLQIPIGAVNALELAHRFDEFEPLPHVIIRARQISFVHRFGYLRLCHFVSFSSAAVLLD